MTNKQLNNEELRRIYKEIERRKLCRRSAELDIIRENVDNFIEYCFQDDYGNPIKQSKMHQEWQEAFAKFPRLFIESHRESAKTYQMLFRILWELGQNPNLIIKIVCETDEKAYERIDFLKNQIMRNKRLRQVFPNLVPAMTSEWSKQKIYIKRDIITKDASVEGAGIKSSAIGGRAHLIIFDDVQTPKVIYSAAERKTIKEMFFTLWMNMLMKYGIAVWIATPFHKDDLHMELKTNKEWKVLSYPIKEDLTPVWKEQWTKERLEKRRSEIGAIHFARAFHLKPISDDEQPFKPSWIIRRKRDEIKINEVICHAYDLALKQDSKADYFAFVSVGLSNGNLVVTNSFHERLSVLEQANVIVNNYHYEKPRQVLIETVQYQEALKQLVEKKDSAIPVKGIKPSKDKWMRALAVQPLLENGKIIFLDGNEQLISELENFPHDSHDDLVDAFIFAVSYAQNFLEKRNEKKEKTFKFFRQERFRNRLNIKTMDL